jgi:hypothetical protein
MLCTTENLALTPISRPFERFSFFIASLVTMYHDATLDDCWARKGIFQRLITEKASHPISASAFVADGPSEHHKSETPVKGEGERSSMNIHEPRLSAAVFF